MTHPGIATVEAMGLEDAGGECYWHSKTLLTKERDFPQHLRSWVEEQKEGNTVQTVLLEGQQAVCRISNLIFPT